MRRCEALSLHCVTLIIGILTAFHPMIFSGGRLLQTDPGDTLLNHYILEHEWRCLSDREYVGTFWSPPFFHPTPNVLAYSENLIGAAPIYWLFRCVLGEVQSFQLW